MLKIFDALPAIVRGSSPFSSNAPIAEKLSSGALGHPKSSPTFALYLPNEQVFLYINMAQFPPALLHGAHIASALPVDFVRTLGVSYVLKVTSMIKVTSNITKQGLLAEVLELEHRAHQLMRQYSLDAWMGLSLTVPQLKSLFFISTHLNTSPGKLAEALGVTPSNVTGIIDRLVEQGLVHREENHKDRRVLVLKLTEKGQSILANLRERRSSRMQEILDDLSEQELNCLAIGLRALVKAAEGLDRQKDMAGND